MEFIEIRNYKFYHNCQSQITHVENSISTGHLLLNMEEVCDVMRLAGDPDQASPRNHHRILTRQSVLQPRAPRSLRASGNVD